MKVIVKTQIHGVFGAISSLDRHAYKTFDLPFTPFNGLTIEAKTKKGETDDITIKEVIWDNANQCFVCWTPSDEEIYEAQLHKISHRSMDEIVNEYIEADWLFEPID